MSRENPPSATDRFRVAGRRVFVAGHRGMVGSAVARVLARRGAEVVTAPWPGIDLRRQTQTESWMRALRPEAVVLAAARVGGILANDARPGEFLYDNLAMATCVLEAARRLDVRKLLFLGSSCIYPREAAQPIREDALLSGPLEPTNQWYAVAKIAGVKLAQAYRRQYGCDYVSAMPCNLYGPGDNFDPATSHVVPGLMRRMHEAKIAGAGSFRVWGSGRVRREFLHVMDLAEAAVCVLERYTEEEPVNIGTGQDLTITKLAELVRDVVGYEGSFEYDRAKPDGAPRKVLDVTRISDLGWRPSINLHDGLRETYEWYLRHAAESGTVVPQ